MKIALSLALATLFFVGCGDDSAQTKSHETTKHEVQKEVTHEVAHQVSEAPKMKEEKKVIKKTVTTLTGADIFTSCAGCHGQHAEKKALGKSQIIKGWDVAKIEKALHGYKDGSYGGAMKGVMKGQASKLSDADIKAVAEHISKI